MKTTSYDPAFVANIRAGGPDANGQPAERAVSDGAGKPCRCCLRQVPAGAEMLILSARPFETVHPYAEQGPIFLCAEDCSPWEEVGLPPILESASQYLMKAYGVNDRIIYGTGQITPQTDLEAYANALFAREDVSYIDVRSATNNCFLTRIPRDEQP